MSGFLGTYHVNLDEKGRLNVPSKFRAILENSYGPQLITVVMRDYLVVFPEKEWEKNESKLENLSGLSEKDREEMRQYYARASECEVKSGKILIPQSQREAVGLTKELVLVGMSKTFEIWASERWKASGLNRL